MVSPWASRPRPPPDLSLVTGNTVRSAFQVGVTSIMAESAAAQDQKKFLLLPEGGNHDIAIFDDVPLGG
jgi:hypothetical protein